MSHLLGSRSSDEEKSLFKPNYNSFQTTEESSVHQPNKYQSTDFEYNSSNSPTNDMSTSFKKVGVIGVAFVVLMCTISFPFSQNVKNSTTSLSATKSTTKPNFVFVLADDVGWNSFGYEKFDLADVTPTINKLAQNGIIMSNYYSQEVCTPARAALMTGRYPVSVGMQYGSVQPASTFALNENEILLPEVLRDSGYKNYILGKWNLGHYNPKYLPTARGFDYFLGFLDGHNYYWSKRDPLADGYFDFMYSDTDCYNIYNGADRDTYSTTLYAEKAVDAINTHDFDSNPMFLYFAPQAAHDPFTDYDGTYPDGLTAEHIGQERFDAG